MTNARPRRARVRTLLADENRLLVACLVLLLSAILIVNAMYVVNRLAAPENESSHVLTSKQPARTPALSASISNISENNEVDRAFTLADDETMLIMTLTITNHTDVTQDFIPTSQLYVRTRSGDYRPMHPSIYAKNQIPGGKIRPGQTLSGQISFGVPKQATNPLLYVDTGWNDEAPVVFDVLR
jgi:hypothetical protein